MKAFLSALVAVLLLSAALLVRHSVSIAKSDLQAESVTNSTFQNREEAYRANNLGVALLEQFNHKEGAEQFRRAVTLDPNLKIAQINLAIALFNVPDYDAALKQAQKAAAIAPNRPQPFYISGLIARTQNRMEEAVTAFKKVLEFDTRDVGANVNLGQVYMQQRRYEEAATAFRAAIEAEPYNATALYNLATALLRGTSRDEGQQLMKRFQALRQSGAATNIGLNYLEQGRYAEAISSTGSESELVEKTTPQVVFQNADAGLPVLNPANRGMKTVADEPFSDLSKTGATLFDFDNDGDLDIAQIAGETATVRLYRNENGKFADAGRSAGDLNKPSGVVGFGIVAGDYDNDGLSDLLVFGSKQTTLFRNAGKGVFENVTVASKIPVSSYTSLSAAFADADHDGDLDVFLGGSGHANNVKNLKDRGDELAVNQLLRNNGDGTFTDVTDAAKIKAPTRAIAVIPTDYDNRRDIDFLVLSYNAPPQLWRNLRDGSFRDVAGEVGLNRADGWTCAAVGDYNKDTYPDFFFGRAGGVGVFAVSDGKGSFSLKDAPRGTENAAAAQFLDYDNDGLLDLIVNTKEGFVVARNIGDVWASADASPFKIKTTPGTTPAGSRQMLSGDLDSDGDIDLLVFAKNGAPVFIRNIGGEKNNSEIVRLTGRVSNKTGIGAKIDMRAGSLAQKLESYSASPAPAPADIHFGLGKREKPDAVRIIWTSGVIQAEVDFPDKTKGEITARRLNIEELDRKPSSCPYLYTWNGERFEFITDFLGGGEMGNWQKEGVYHYPDSDEFVRITSDQLKPKNGRYEIRVTNELEEVLFLDHLKLVAVEHDAETEVYPNEGLGIPTAGKRILYTTHNERAPKSAVDTNGDSVLQEINELDRRFYDRFKSQKIRGYAETHNLTLNLDDKKSFNGRTLLLLTGWTDYAFSSDNLAASQSGKSLFLPKLQVKNKRGDWETVVESIGISVGRPQTVVVDLTGKFLTDSREVRIVTNFKTYWDKISVNTSAQKDLKTTELNPAQADLRERGFSEEIKFGGMITANYDKALNDGRWKYFSGNFTRTGAVDSLLEATDDVFVISKTGDELVLSFNALPELPKNKKYTFLLYADGYSKEMDINSGSPDAVFPLPFKKMTKYPYESNESFPMTEDKHLIYEKYTTRTVKGFLPRIEAALLR